MDEESVGSRGARTLYSLTIGKIIGVAITAVTFIAMARLLGPSGYGIYTLALGFSAFIDAVGHFGIGTYFNKHLSEFIAKKDEQGILSALNSGYFILAVIGILLSSVGIALSSVAAVYFFKSSGVHAATLEIASLTILFSMLYGAAYSALVGVGRGKHAAISANVVYSVQLVMGVGLILIGFGVNGAVTGILLGYLVGASMTAYYIIRSLSNYAKLKFYIPSKEEVRGVLRFSLPIAANNLLNSGISNFAIMLLGVYGTAYLLGNYGMATKGLSLMLVFSGTMTTVLLATFSSAVAKTSRDRIGSFYNKALIYSLLATLPPIIYIGIFSKPLVFIFITKQYSLTPLYVSLMALGTAIGLPWLYSSSFMVANGYVKKVLKYAAVSVAVQLAVMLLLIRQFTTIGVIVSIFFVGNIVSDILLAGGISNVLGIKYESRKLVKVAFAGVIAVVFTMLGLLLHSFWLQLIIGAVIFLLIYPFALLFVRILDSIMLNDVMRIVKGLPLLDKFINLEVAYIYALSKFFRIKIS